jgi:hypothetical protein
LTLKAGDKVTIQEPAGARGTHRATVVGVDSGHTLFEFRAYAGWTGARALADEGFTWCCGWEGEAVEALKATTLLMSDAAKLAAYRRAYGGA